MSTLADPTPPQTRPASSKDPATWSYEKRRRYGWLVTISLLFLMMLSWADKAVLGKMVFANGNDFLMLKVEKV